MSNKFINLFVLSVLYLLFYYIAVLSSELLTQFVSQLSKSRDCASLLLAGAIVFWDGILKTTGATTGENI